VTGREGCDGTTDCPADFHHPDCHAECSSCGHQQREHVNRGHGHCEVDVLGLNSEWRRCTCRYATKPSGRSVLLSQMRGLLAKQERPSVQPIKEKQ
jgi:hypothetical protein